MRLVESRPFDYVGYHGCHSRCDLRVFTDGTAYLVIATEREDNPGTSVTNMAEHLAWAVWRYLECPAAFTWIEHYRDRALFGGRPQFKETFDIVTFKRDARGRFFSPDWRPFPNPRSSSVPAARSDPYFLSSLARNNARDFF